MLVHCGSSIGFVSLVPKKNYKFDCLGFRAGIVNCSHNQSGQPLNRPKTAERLVVKKSGKEPHHLWKKRDSAGSGQKALNLIRIISQLPNEKEAVYGALNKWIAWETEFPLIAAAKALRILRERGQWKRAIQVAKWMLSKGQGATMGTYDTLLLAFDMDKRVDEAESLWNMILHTYTRSISKRLFSRMICLYDHHDLQDKIIEVLRMEIPHIIGAHTAAAFYFAISLHNLSFFKFYMTERKFKCRNVLDPVPQFFSLWIQIFADMEELGVKPDEDTVQRVGRAFQKLGQEENRKLVYKRYGCKWKYIHFKGDRVRVKRGR